MNKEQSGEIENLQEMKNKFNRVDMLEAAKQATKTALHKAVELAAQAGELKTAELPDFVVEQPADTTHGDLAANIALVSAKTFGMAPRAIAQAIVNHFDTTGYFEKIEVAGPGFINLFLGGSFFSDVVRAAYLCGDEYGRTNIGAGEKVNVEFVSANPTGPMHLGNARGGALGDCLASAMDWAGYEVTREFYVNDAGNQIVRFGVSLAARYLQIVKGEDAVPFPEDGYQGEDIRQRAQEFYDIHGTAYAEKSSEELEKALVDYALPKNIEGLKNDLASYRVEYDVWFRESTLHQDGSVQKTVDKLTERGAVYEKDGVLWYKATDFGGEKDEVLVRANGIPTYFAADIAYHANKFERGFTTAIDVWGADHHGHVARMKGALDALGITGAKLDIVLMQFVRLVRDGQIVKMSKRTGKAITLTNLLEEVPIDSARFFFNMREPGSQIDFDLDLAVAEDSENPVYYVQYAHARIASILRNLEGEGVFINPAFAFENLGVLTAPEEKELIRKIAEFPGVIASAAKGYDPARITRFIVELSNAFHKFYAACRVKGESQDVLQARLALCMVTKRTLANGLEIIKVNAPERM